MIQIIPDSENGTVFIQINNISKLTEDGIRKAFYYIGADLVKTSRKLINKKPKGGRLYRVKVNGRWIWHRGSAPGEAPAVITGRLKNSLDYSIQGAEGMEFGSRRNVNMFQSGQGKDFVFSGFRRGKINYPKFLELGTSKMAARPFLKPSINANERNIRRYFNNEVLKSLKS